MPNTLEATLAHYTQLMRYNFIYLDPGITQTTKAQMPHLEKLGVSVNRLRITLEKLPPSYDSLDKAMWHGIRNELSIISTRTQLLRTKRVEELGHDASQYLQNILNACELFIKAL